MRNQYFTIQINGEPFHCINKMSLQNILSYLDIDASFSLIEYNNEIIQDDQLHHIFLQNNDKLEIITIVGGG
uniref:thiamine biosynthesis protein n=1 Tax=Rhodochorton tenue TaxID=173034 RepID=UPI002A82134B|nr:thiamine biosynthesis protein [Rhodochorton tenue]WOK79416.1 thiamine biosynthesis protein [Rhodochorton tenue]